MGTAQADGGNLLGAADIRRIAAEEGITPTKKFGQNFVIDPGTVRKIVREAGVDAGDQVMEVGPGLGSLTLAILETGADLTAVEIDPPLAQRLPQTIAEFMPNATNRFRVVNMDALKVTPSQLTKLSDAATFTLVANLPYNVATPILLTLLERFGNLDSFLVMVQKEVAERLSAQPGSKVYGTPSVKLAWYGTAKSVGNIGRNVFWPAPNVDSALVRFERHARRPAQSQQPQCGARSGVPAHRRLLRAATQDTARGIEENRALRRIRTRGNRPDSPWRDARHRRIRGARHRMQGA